MCSHTARTVVKISELMQNFKDVEKEFGDIPVFHRDEDFFEETDTTEICILKGTDWYHDFIVDV